MPSADGIPAQPPHPLIWKRFVASQMSPALYTVTGAVLYAGKAQGQAFPMEFRAQARSLLFDGLLKVYEEPADEGEENNETGILPPLKDNEPVQLVSPQVTDHQTRAPSRYTESALVQALEQHGIGRPSTYASMVKPMRQSPRFALLAPA